MRSRDSRFALKRTCGNYHQQSFDLGKSGLPFTLYELSIFWDSFLLYLYGCFACLCLCSLVKAKSEADDSMLLFDFALPVWSGNSRSVGMINARRTVTLQPKYHPSLLRKHGFMFQNSMCFYYSECFLLNYAFLNTSTVNGVSLSCPSPSHF